MDTKVIKSHPGFEIKAREEGVVEAIVSVFGIVDNGSDLIQKGTFAGSIEKNLPQKKIKVLNCHNQLDATAVIGVCLDAREVGREDLPATVLARWPEATGGLWTKTQYALNTQDGNDIYELIKMGALTEFSIGAYLRESEQIKRNGRTVREITEMDLIEYSVVVYGQNPATLVTVTKAERAEQEKVTKAADNDAETSTKSESAPDEPALPEGTELLQAIADLMTTSDNDAPPIREYRSKTILKRLAQVLTEPQLKGLAVQDIKRTIETQFYRQYDTGEESWWVHSLYSDFLVAYDFRDHLKGRYFRVPYTIGAGGIVEFDDDFAAVVMAWEEYDFDSLGPPDLQLSLPADVTQKSTPNGKTPDGGGEKKDDQRQKAIARAAQFDSLYQEMNE